MYSKYRKLYGPRSRELRLFREYGMSAGQYALLLEKQLNVCAICRLACSSGRKLAVDHSHRSGRIRGLLCVRCNLMVGLSMDSSEILSLASKYLLENV